MKGKNLYYALVFLQILVIVFLGFRLFERQKVASRAIGTIPKDHLTIPSSQELKYFYEPTDPGWKEEASWIKNKAVYTVNKDGQNERYEYRLEKDPETFRVVTIGDSHTFGHYVNTADNYPEKLEDLLNKESCPGIKKIEVINLGMMGYDIQYAVQRYNLRGRQYKPDLVLWFLKNDDFSEISELITERVEELKREQSNQNLEVSKLYYPWERAREELLAKYGEENILNEQRLFLNKFPEEQKDKLLIFTYNNTEEKYKNLMREFIKPNDAYFWDGINYDKIDKFAEGHPTEKGYLTISKNLLDKMLASKIIPCGI